MLSPQPADISNIIYFHSILATPLIPSICGFHPLSMARQPHPRCLHHPKPKQQIPLWPLEYSAQNSFDDSHFTQQEMAGNVSILPYVVGCLILGVIQKNTSRVVTNKIWSICLSWAVPDVDICMCFFDLNSEHIQIWARPDDNDRLKFSLIWMHCLLTTLSILY